MPSVQKDDSEVEFRDKDLTRHRRGGILLPSGLFAIRISQGEESEKSVDKDDGSGTVRTWPSWEAWDRRRRSQVYANPCQV